MQTPQVHLLPEGAGAFIPAAAQLKPPPFGVDCAFGCAEAGVGASQTAHALAGDLFFSMHVSHVHSSVAAVAGAFMPAADQLKPVPVLVERMLEGTTLQEKSKEGRSEIRTSNAALEAAEIAGVGVMRVGKANAGSSNTGMVLAAALRSDGLTIDTAPSTAPGKKGDSRDSDVTGGLVDPPSLLGPRDDAPKSAVEVSCQFVQRKSRAEW